MDTIRRSYYRIRRSEKEGLASGSARIAVLADLHNRVYRSDIPTLIKAIKEEKCDAVLSAGDLVVMKGGRFATDQAIRLVRSLAGRMPFFLANGNHETRMERLYTPQYQKYEEAVKASGAILLHNACRNVMLNDLPVSIAGLELDRRYFRNKYHKDLYVEEIREQIGPSSPDRFQILLAHHPKYFPVYAKWGADLTLSGHLHGGIARLPWLGGVISPDPELFPHYDHGLFEEQDARMIVSAGLGTHTINLRINNPAELVIADIKVEHESWQ